MRRDIASRLKGKHPPVAMEQWKKTEMPTGHTFSRPTGVCGQAESIVFFVAVSRGQ